MDIATVESTDGEIFETGKARTISKRMFYAGFCFLPLVWFVNVWLFWPDFRHGGDSEVKKYTRYSAVGFVVYSILFLPWMLLYLIGGADVIGYTTWYRMDATRLNINQFGLG